MRIVVGGDVDGVIGMVEAVEGDVVDGGIDGAVKRIGSESEPQGSGIADGNFACDVDDVGEVIGFESEVGGVDSGIGDVDVVVDAADVPADGADDVEPRLDVPERTVGGDELDIGTLSAAAAAAFGAAGIRSGDACGDVDERKFVEGARDEGIGIDGGVIDVDGIIDVDVVDGDGGADGSGTAFTVESGSGLDADGSADDDSAACVIGLEILLSLFAEVARG